MIRQPPRGYYGLPNNNNSNNNEAHRRPQARNRAAQARQAQEAANLQLARRIQANFNAAAAQGVNIPQNVQRAVVAVGQQAANRAANGNNNERRRARQIGAEIGGEIAVKLVEAKRLLAAAARYAANGSVILARKLGEKAARLSQEVMAIAPERQVIRDYAGRIFTYSQGLLRRIGGAGLLTYATNLLGRLRYGSNNSRLPASLRENAVRVNLNEGTAANVRRRLQLRINTDQEHLWEPINNIPRNNRKQIYAYDWLKSQAEYYKLRGNQNRSNRAVKTLRKVTKLPSRTKRPVRTNLNTFMNNNLQAENKNLFSLENIKQPYLIIKHEGIRDPVRVNPDSLTNQLKHSVGVSLNQRQLRDWLRMAKRNFPDEKLFKNPIIRNRWVTAKNIYWAKSSGEGQAPQNRNNNNSELIRQLININLSSMTNRNGDIVSKLERLDQSIPEFATCTSLVHGAQRLAPDQRRAIYTRVIVLLRVVLYRKQITNAIKNFIQRTWPDRTNNGSLRAIAQNIRGTNYGAPLTGIGLNLPRRNQYNVGGTGMCHFEALPRTNAGRKAREDRLNQIRVLFHKISEEFIKKRNSSWRKGSYDIETARKFRANITGPCVDDALNALGMAIGFYGA